MQYFCKNIDKYHSNKVKSAVGLKGTYWDNGSTLTISFMTGTSSQKTFVQNIIKSVESLVNLKFQFVGSGGMIRIAFNPNDGAWSYVGKECLSIPKNKPTMNLGWLDEGVVRHEFGHTLGLCHEHQNPKAPIQWNESNVIKDLSGAPNFWDLATIKSNVLDRYNLNEVDATDTDPNSVMMYPIPAKWCLDGFSATGSNDYSVTDKAFLAKLYPFKDAPVVTTTESTIEPVLPIEVVKKIFTSPDDLKMLAEKTLVNIGKTLDLSTDMKKMRSENLKLVHDKLFK